MPVTFRSKAYENITMVQKDADQLLEMMGHSGTIPSALAAKDIPGALERLHAALESAEARESRKPKADEGGDDGYEDGERKKDKVGIALRAWPLIQMLEASVAADTAVMWE
jgi:hypothetical protein